MRKDKKDFLSRLDAALAKKKLSDRAASEAAGYGPDLIRDWRRREKTMPTIDAVLKLAEVVERTPEYLAFNRIGRRSSPQKAMPIIGEIAAGLWLDLDGFEDREYEQHPIPFHPGYPEDAQYGLIVLGTSINNIAKAGEVLQCVDIGISGLAPQNGDLVVVERKRAGQKEVTAKVYKRKGKLIELAPDSSDSRWTTPLTYDPTTPVQDEEITIIAVVYAVYKPLRSGAKS